MPRRTWRGPRSLPAHLAHLADDRRFVLWRYGSKPNGKGKYPKIPYNPQKQITDAKPQGTYKGAATNDPTTWGTFAECMTAAADWPGWFDGVGLVLLPGDVGIDADDCYSSDGALSPLASDLVQDARGRAYIERSVSKTGIHLLELGHIPDALKTDAIEMYEGGEGKGRYFTLSGDELPGSARPAAAQDFIDRTYKAHAGVGKQSARNPFQAGATVAFTPELSDDVQAAEQDLPNLLRDLTSNMTVQLHDLIYLGTFPPAMKDTSSSGARAVVVAQLHRAPKRKYTDAEIYVLARALWRRKGWEGAMAGSEKALRGDCWRLIALYRPGAAPKRKRTYAAAPEPLVYLRLLMDEAVGNAILLNRDERRAIANVSRPTAQRLEEKLVELDYIRLDTYALSGPGSKGRRGMIVITPAGFQALGRPNESVIFADATSDDQVTPTAPETPKPAIEPAKNTLLCDIPQTTTTPCSSPPALVPLPDEWADVERWLASPAGQRLLAKAGRTRVDEEVYARVDAVASGRGLAVVRRYSADECDAWLAANAPPPPAEVQILGAPIRSADDEVPPSAGAAIACLKAAKAQREAAHAAH
jgi:hypothetical protein